MTRLLPVPVLPVPAKQSYRVTNWPACNRSLVTRGQVTLWLHEEVQLGWRASGGKGIRASDAAILCALSLRAACKLPLRQAQGLLGSLMALLDPTAPVPLFAIGAAGGCTGGAGAGAGGAERPVASAIDLTGLKLFGEGEWSEADQKTGWGPVFPPNAPAWQGETPGSGASCIWQWTKEGVRSSPLSLTPSSRHDRPALPDLLAKVPDLLAMVEAPVAVVSADKGCDSLACHRAIPAIGARPVIPPRTGAAITP